MWWIICDTTVPLHVLYMQHVHVHVKSVIEIRQRKGTTLEDSSSFPEKKLTASGRTQTHDIHTCTAYHADALPTEPLRYMYMYMYIIQLGWLNLKFIGVSWCTCMFNMNHS